MVSADGKLLVQEMLSGSRQDVGFEHIDRKQFAIEDAFLNKLFQILVELPEMTATQALQRAQEKGQLLGPTMGRQQSESLNPTIEREIDIMSRRGQIGEMESKGKLAVIHAAVPLKEMFGYSTAVRTLSSGRASYSMTPSHFEQVPPNIVEQIINER